MHIKISETMKDVLDCMDSQFSDVLTAYPLWLCVSLASNKKSFRQPKFIKLPTIYVGTCRKSTHLALLSIERGRFVNFTLKHLLYVFIRDLQIGNFSFESNHESNQGVVVYVFNADLLPHELCAGLQCVLPLNNSLSVAEHVQAVISSCAQILSCMLWEYCALMAWTIPTYRQYIDPLLLPNSHTHPALGGALQRSTETRRIHPTKSA